MLNAINSEHKNNEEKLTFGRRDSIEACLNIYILFLLSFLRPSEMIIVFVGVTGLPAKPYIRGVINY